jgi:hypothetical protein
VLEDPSPKIVVGITSPQTCHVLGGRLRALREAGFRVALVASPGDLLGRLGESEGVDTVGIPMARRMAPLADLVSLARLWFFLMRLRPDVVEFGTPKAGLLGMLAAMFAGVPRRIYLLRGLKSSNRPRVQAKDSARDGTNRRGFGTDRSLCQSESAHEGTCPWPRAGRQTARVGRRQQQRR